MGRSPCCPKHSVLHRGAWTLQEDLVLSEYITSHGEGRWRSLPQKAGLKRCGKSCRLRWLNYLRPDIKRGDISPDEEDLIVRLHRLLGNRWSLIAGRLPNRTDNEIKNYWNTHLGKKIMTENVTLSKQRTESRPALTATDRVVKSTPVKAKPVRLVKGHNKYLAAGNSNRRDLNSIHPEPAVHTSASAEELLVQELTTELDSDFTMWKYIPELGSPSIEINGHFNFPCMPNLVELQSPPSQPCAKNDVNTSDNSLYLNGDLPSLDYDLLCSPWNSAEDFKIDELEVSLTHELEQRWCYSIQNNVSPVNKSLTDEQEIDINPEEAHWVDGLHCLPNSSIQNFTEL